MKKMRKLLSLVMVFALVISMTTIGASANSEITDECSEHEHEEICAVSESGTQDEAAPDTSTSESESVVTTAWISEAVSAENEASVAEQSIENTNTESAQLTEMDAESTNEGITDVTIQSSGEDAENLSEALDEEEIAVEYEIFSDVLYSDGTSESDDTDAPVYNNGPCLDSCDVLIEGNVHYAAAFEALDLINELREEVGCDSLIMDPTLLTHAVNRAVQTALYCAHSQPNGAAHSYGCDMADQENIHFGTGSYGTAQGAVNGWANSIGHYSNIVASDYKSTGIGVFEVSGQYFWVQVFSKEDGTEVYASNYTDKSLSTTVNIADYRITDKIELEVGQTSLQVGETTTIEIWFTETALCHTAFMLPSDGMTFTASDSSVITVSSSGLVTAIGEGTATVSATYPGYDLDPWTFEVTVCNHSYTSAVTTDPTCTEDGVRTYTCSKCGGTYTEEVNRLGHDWDNGTVTTAATCVDNGVRTYTCETCGATRTGTEFATGIHTYDDGVVTTQPTCGAAGVKTYTCTVCGGTKTEAVSATGDHTYDDGVVGIPPTCLGSGTMIYTCTGCGYNKSKIIKPTGHDLGEETYYMEPTCTSNGYSGQQCRSCGEWVNLSIVNKLEHDYDEGVPQEDVVCASVVEMLYTCRSCGHELTSTEYITHIYDDGYVSTAATCSTKGKTTYTCTRCGKTKIIADIAALGHSEITDPGIEPTCTSTGLTEGSHCERCGEVIVAQTTLAKADHSYASKVVAPTCTARGYTEHTCTVCGDNYQDTPTSSLGHTWNSGTVTTAATCVNTGVKTYTCETCGSTKTESVAATGHSYKETVIAPTCTTGGYTEHICSACGDSYQDTPTSSLGHTWDAGTVTTEPTCTSKGVRTHTCTVCGGTKTEAIDALGHEAVSDVAVAATCEATGLTEGSHCGRCKIVLVAQETTPALGHTWDDGIITTASTCEATGVKTYTCETCGSTKTESVAATGHSYQETVVAPTCTEAGYTKHTCSACGNSYTDTETAATGHTWDSGVTTKEATTTETGEKTYTCTACGTTRIEQIPALGTEEQLDYDINADGLTNSLDLVALMKHVTGAESARNPDAADTNGDGTIDILDVIRLIRYLGMQGDVDLNGTVATEDASQILLHVTGQESVMDDEETGMLSSITGDVNGDGIIDARDATQILRYANDLTSLID